jgi:hypothetical protein
LWQALPSSTGITEIGEKWHYTRPMEHTTLEPHDEGNVHFIEDQRTIERSEPMQHEALTREALTSLLKEAEKAHAEYEYALGHRDPDWATWYAGFIIERLQEDRDLTNLEQSTQPTGERTDGQLH